jgi:hypothetical protein
MAIQTVRTRASNIFNFTGIVSRDGRLPQTHRLPLFCAGRDVPVCKLISRSKR